MKNTISIPAEQIEPMVLDKHIEWRKGYKARLHACGHASAQAYADCRVLPDLETLLYPSQATAFAPRSGQLTATIPPLSWH